MPYISVIASSNRIGGLDVLFSSLACQTFKDFELVLVDGLYDYRKELVAEQSQKYHFKTKHISQPNTGTSFALAINNGIVNSSGHIVYIIPDYTWVASDCLQIHANFHQNEKPNSNYALIGHFWDCALPALDKRFYRKYASPEVIFYREKQNNFLEEERKNYNNYIEDLNEKRLDPLMWSIFEKPFNNSIDPLTFEVSVPKLLKQEGLLQSDNIQNNCCVFKNESYVLENVLNINGLDESMDSSHGWHDQDFSDRLNALQGTKLYHKPNALVWTINPRPIMYARYRTRPVFANEAIWENSKKNKFKNPINSYSLREKRNSILTNKEKSPIIHSTKKPQISIICPTMRIGGLDTLFNSLERSTFKDFELIISDSLYHYRKDIVANKAKEYSFRYKHISPIADKFPIFSQAHSANSAIVQAEGDILLFITDYRYFTPDCLQKHFDFHQANPDNLGYAPGSKYLLPPPVKKGIPHYGRNADYDRYISDLKNGTLNEYMWSIFEGDIFSTNPELSTWPEIDRFKIGYDPKTIVPPGVEVPPTQIFTQSESVKTKLVLAANGFNEALDGAFNYVDIEFAHRLRNLFGLKWIGDNTNTIYRITGGDHIINKAKLVEDVQNKAQSIFQKYENGSTDPVNTWSLAATHTTNQIKKKENEKTKYSIQPSRNGKYMKIAFLFGAWSIGSRPLDFNNLWSSPRGLTGSDLGVAITAKEMAKLGHDVSLFTVHGTNKPDTWEGVKLYHIGEKNTLIDNTFDAVVSWSEPDILRDLPARPVKAVCMMLNDFTYCQPGFDNAVDVWTAPCQMLIDHLMTKPEAPPRHKFEVLYLGCEPSWYSDKRIPGLMFWASSPDRGLHLLLQEFPKIKKAVPHAELRIFYNFNYSSVEGMEPNSNNHPHFLELGHRARYMKEAIKRLEPLGVKMMGSVSRERMEEEMSMASVLACPTDTVAFTEGYSCTIAESHASYCVPVISDTDCLGHVYENSGAIVIKDIRKNLDQFTNQVIKALTDKQYADSVIQKCLAWAEEHTWAKATQKLETMIKERLRK
jgi:glycosyltransferase involved in cell wall biosynthesis